MTKKEQQDNFYIDFDGYIIDTTENKEYAFANEEDWKKICKKLNELKKLEKETEQLRIALLDCTKERLMKIILGNTEID